MRSYQIQDIYAFEKIEGIRRLPEDKRRSDRPSQPGLHPAPLTGVC